jgi:hypothetical protein
MSDGQSVALPLAGMAWRGCSTLLAEQPATAFYLEPVEREIVGKWTAVAIWHAQPIVVFDTRAHAPRFAEIQDHNGSSFERLAGRLYAMVLRPKSLTVKGALSKILDDCGPSIDENPFNVGPKIGNRGMPLLMMDTDELCAPPGDPESRIYINPIFLEKRREGGRILLQEKIHPGTGNSLNAIRIHHFLHATPAQCAVR